MTPRLTPRRVLAGLAAAALLGAVPLGCSGDTLGKKFTPTKQGGDAGLGPLSPVAKGDTLILHFVRRYLPTASSVNGEVQSSGYMCIKVSQVKDTATPDYQNAAQTLVDADVRVVGGAGTQDIVAQPDAATADTDDDALWLQHLLGPSANNPYAKASATSEEFNTQGAPIPPSYKLVNLLFFDPRTSRDEVWGGWTGYSPSAPEHKSFLTGLYTYFGSLAATDLSKLATSFNPNCATYTDYQSCTAQNACTFDFNSNACVSYYTVNIYWRETISTGGSELQGPVLHSLSLQFNQDGTLYSADETIQKDTTSPGSTLPSPDYFNQACSNSSCAAATIETYQEPWSSAQCTF